MIYRRTALSLSIVLACSALAACSDSPTALSTPAPAETLASAVTAQAPAALAPQDMALARIETLRDALFRVQPTLLRDDRATALGVGLRQAIDALVRKEEKNARTALQGIEQTLLRYTPRDNAMSPDLDVIRLAVSAASAR